MNLQRLFKLLSQQLNPIIIDCILFAIASLERVYRPKMASNA